MPIEIRREEECKKIVYKLELLSSCLPATQLCNVIKKVQPVLSTKELIYWCSRVSSMCAHISGTLEGKCAKASYHCMKAVEALSKGNEEKYLDLCKMATKACPQLFNPLKVQESNDEDVVLVQSDYIR